MASLALAFNGPSVSLRSFADRFLSGSLSMVLVVMMLMTALFTTGCSSSQVLTEVEKFEPAILNALVLACVVSPAAAICGNGSATIKADYDLVVKVWADYNQAVASGTATAALWNYLNAVFATYEQDSSAIFALGLGLNSPEITEVIAATQVLLAAIEVLFPAAPAGAMSAKSNLFANHATKPSPNYNGTWFAGWTADYNGKVKSAQMVYPKAHLNAIHVHNFLFRAVGFGRIQ